MARPVALIALTVLGAALAVAILVTTPWAPLPEPLGGPVAAAPERDFTAAQMQRTQTYRSFVRWPSYASLAVALLLAVALGLTRLGARLVAAAGRPLGGSWLAQVVGGTVAVTLSGRLVTLPFSFRIEAVRRDYELSTRTWGGWAVDLTKAYAVSTLVLVVVVASLVWLARRWRRWWWAPAAAGGALLVVAGSFAYPLVVEPVFNEFRPLAQGPLRSDLVELAAREGLSVEEVLVADASRRTSALNAYVSGFGSTRRIVVYDTLLAQATPAEVRLIVAHELGHAQARDVLHGTLIGALGAAAGVCLLYLVLTSPWALRRAGVHGVRDPRSVALVLLTVTLLSTLSGPVQMLVSRRIEARADVASLELTRDPAAFVAMQRRLAVTNLSDLDPPALLFWLFSSHPTAPQRIALAREWALLQGLPVPAGVPGEVGG
jgi:STE24 endopeptidase